MTKIISVYIREPKTVEEEDQAMLQELYQGPIPPTRYKKSAKAFWLAYVDTDGRNWVPEPYQWQPGAKRWCRINCEGTPNCNLDLRNWVIVGEVVMPDFVLFDVSVNKVVVHETEQPI